MASPAAPAEARPGLTGLLIRAGLFVLFVWTGSLLFGGLLHGLFENLLVSAALGVFLASAAASALVVRIFERGRLEDVGLTWWPDGGRHFLSGTLAGLTAGLAAVLVPAAFWLAEIVRAPEPELAFSPGKFLFVTVLLWFGAAGEELMFRGYAFQILLRRLGPWQTILPFALLFALAHTGNPNAEWTGLAVTGYLFPVLLHTGTTAYVARAGVRGGLGAAFLLAWAMQVASGLAARLPLVGGVPVGRGVGAVLAVALVAFLWRVRLRAERPAVSLD